MSEAFDHHPLLQRSEHHWRYSRCGSGFSWPDKEIIVVDDCSNDGTRQKLKDEIEPAGVVAKIFYHEVKQGKGAAIRTGVTAATGELVIIQDADLEYDPNEYPQLIEPILENKADVVFGSRFAGGDAHRVMYFWHRVGNGFLTLASNMFININLTDMETCYLNTTYFD